MNESKRNFRELSEAITVVANSLAKHVVPLFYESPSHRPEFVGSGFLVARSNSHYLISAAHVFDEIKHNELFFYIEPSLTKRLAGTLRLTKIPTGSDRRSDPFDVGVLKLAGPRLPPYPKVNKFPISVDAFMPTALPRQGKSYLLFGFPASKTRLNFKPREVLSQLQIYWNDSVPTSTYSKLGISEETHVLLRFDQNKCVGPDGRLLTFPNPKGMSGSPVWLLSGKNSKSFAVLPIVGVAIEHHRVSRVIKITDIEFVRKLIDGA